MESIRNLVRGLSPFPAAWTNLVHQESGQQIQCKIFFVQKLIVEASAEPGTIESDDEKQFKCGLWKWLAQHYRPSAFREKTDESHRFSAWIPAD